MNLPIGQIIKGHVAEALNLNQDIAEARLKICYACPLFLNKLGGICNNKLWLNPNTGDVSTEKKDGYMRGCGCILKSKTRVSNAHCPIGKW